MLQPRLETWILKVAKDAKVDVKVFGLDDDWKSLHKNINQKLPQFRNLIEHLLNESNEALLQLKLWLGLEK